MKDTITTHSKQPLNVQNSKKCSKTSKVLVHTASNSSQKAITCKYYGASGNAHNCKVSADNDQFLSQNKFGPLYPGDDVISCVTDDRTQSKLSLQNSVGDSDQALTVQPTKTSLYDGQVLNPFNSDHPSHTSVLEENGLSLPI